MSDTEHENEPSSSALNSAAKQSPDTPESTNAPEQPADDGSASQADKSSAVTSAPAPPAPRRSGRGLAVLALTLGLIATAGAGYALYQIEWVQKLAHVQQNAQLDRQLDSLKATVKQLAEQDAQLRQSQQTLAQNNEGIKTGLQGLAKQQETLTGSLEKVYTQLNRSLDSWALEEVEQLMRIANQSLVLNRDVSTAIAGLELADERLKELGDPALLPVRRQIANDVASLKSVPEVDISGIALRLASMRDTIANLPLQQQFQRDLAAKPTQTAAATESGWLTSTKELLSDTLGVIRIQNITAPVRPLLTPEQRHFLQGNLRLMLGGAQLAALRGDTATYRDNLKQAQQWLREYFRQGDGRVKKAIDDIGELAKLELNPQLPDISGSANALEASKQKLAQGQKKAE